MNGADRGQVTYFCTTRCGKRGSPYVVAVLPSSRVQVTTGGLHGHVGAANARVQARDLPREIASVVRKFAHDLITSVIAGGGGVGTLARQWIPVYPSIPLTALMSALALIALGLVLLRRPGFARSFDPAAPVLEPMVEGESPSI